MNSVLSPVVLENTRHRLLEAAREVFAESGFRGATIREICRRADVNIAAVNYHFNGKEALFMAALDVKPVENLIATSECSNCAEERLSSFIAELLTRLMGECSSTQSKLIMQELVEPSLVLDSIVKDVIAPMHEYLGALVREIIGQDANDDLVRRCVFSIFGQCAFYRHSGEAIHRQYPNLQYDTAEIAATAQHITKFSLAGLKRVGQ